jgi:glycosyltransferase involved in cell wall biosynthesis
VRLLHIGTGFRPLRHGGLVAYVEDLMHEQARRGHEVAYFFSGRHYPWFRSPRLRRWRNGPLAMLEVVNSPLYDHGRQPELEVGEPRIEEMLRRAMRELRPDAVHVQELAGLPTSVLDVVRDAGIPAVVTLQDYFPLCSTFKLLDSEGRVCLRREIGADCVATVAADGRPPGLMVAATMRHELVKRPLLRRLDPNPPHRRIGWVAHTLAARVPRPPAAGPGAFQRRREVNVERLNRAERVIAMSSRVAEIYSTLGVDPDRIRTLQLTLAHIERLRPREVGGRLPVVFGTLNGLASTAKGARLVIEAFRIVADGAPPGSFRLLAFGAIDRAVEAEARRIDAIELRGPFAPEELDGILDEVDVGIVPSIWEEAYGYVGPELLAKGIPVIANAIGGMVDYTREGETGWLNRSRSPQELAGIVLEAIERPELVAELGAKIRAARDEIVKPMARHADEMDAIYAELVR